MRISYDSKSDILYLKFGDSNHQTASQNLTDDVAIDVDEKGKIAGIELFPPLNTSILPPS